MNTIAILLGALLALSTMPAHADEVAHKPVGEAKLKGCRRERIVVKKTDYAVLFKLCEVKAAGSEECSAPTKSCPHHYSVTWKGIEAGGSEKPLFVFVEPSDGKHPIPPSMDKVYLTRKPIGQPKGEHIWGESQRYFPTDAAKNYGLVARAWYLLKKGQGLKGMELVATAPILWWGLKKGQELDEGDASDHPSPKAWFPD